MDKNWSKLTSTDVTIVNRLVYADYTATSDESGSDTIDQVKNTDSWSKIFVSIARNDAKKQLKILWFCIHHAQRNLNDRKHDAKIECDEGKRNLTDLRNNDEILYVVNFLSDNVDINLVDIPKEEYSAGAMYITIIMGFTKVTIRTIASKEVVVVGAAGYEILWLRRQKQCSEKFPGNRKNTEAWNLTPIAQKIFQA